MFLSLARLFTNPQDLFFVHPIQLSRWLDEAWAAASDVPVLPPNTQVPAPIPGTTGKPFIGDNAIIDALKLPPEVNRPSPPLLSPSGVLPPNTGQWDEKLGPGQVASPALPGLVWHHLIYAYLIESTGVFEIFSEVVRRSVVGETLAELDAPSIQYLRATEELFFRDPPLFSIAGVVSEVRPHARTNRRNTYWRMFGMDLPHASPTRYPSPSAFADWKADTGNGVNSDFREKWNELLRQVWLAVENADNETGANPADDGYIASLCRAIRDMFGNRRRGGLLAREEFVYASLLSWFHLTLDTQTNPILDRLQAKASSPADRLSAIGDRVGMRPAARSRELFELAEPMSTILRAIESGLFDKASAAKALYETGSPVREEMVNIINNWQSATGERVKERPVGTTVTTGPAQPLRVPAPGASTVMATSGSPSGNGGPR
jgi:hypothetical protein